MFIDCNLDADTANNLDWMDYDGSGDEAIVEIASNGFAGKIRGARIDDDRFAVIFQETSTTGAIVMHVVDLADGTPVGTEVEVKTSGTTIDNSDFGVAVANTSNVTAFYQDNSAGSLAKNYTLSGSTLTLDATWAIDASIANSILALEYISATRGFCYYATGPTTGAAVGFTRGSGTLTPDGTTATLPAGVGVDTQNPKIAKAGTGKAIITLPRSSGAIDLCKITDGTPIVFGTPTPTTDFVAEGNSHVDPGLTMRDDYTRGYVTYVGSSGSGSGIKAFEFDGTNITIPTISSYGSMRNPHIANRSVFLEQAGGVDHLLQIGSSPIGVADEMTVTGIRCGSDPELIGGGGAARLAGSDAISYTGDLIRLTSSKVVALVKNNAGNPAYVVINKPA
jgi:hypothetical protein